MLIINGLRHHLSQEPLWSILEISLPFGEYSYCVEIYSSSTVNRLDLTGNQDKRHIPINTPPRHKFNRKGALLNPILFRC